MRKDFYRLFSMRLIQCFIYYQMIRYEFRTLLWWLVQLDKRSETACWVHTSRSKQPALYCHKYILMADFFVQVKTFLLLLKPKVKTNCLIDLIVILSHALSPVMIAIRKNKQKIYCTYQFILFEINKSRSGTIVFGRGTKVYVVKSAL